MSADWPIVKLADCASFQEGYVNPTQKKPEYFDGEVKWLRAVDLNNGYVRDTSRTLSKEGFDSAGKSALLFGPGTLAISKSGTIGRVGILQDYMCGNRAVINIKVDEEKCNNRFIFYVLIANRPIIENLAIGSVQKNLYTSALGSLEFRLPPKNIQDLIAESLGSLDDKIELNRQTNQTLEHIAQAIFKSWFVDFEPTRAKIAAKEEWAKRCLTAKDGGNDENAGAIFVERAAMAAISGKSIEELDQLSAEQQEQLKTTAALFPDALVDSELGEIPEGWEVSPLSFWGNIICGKTPSKKKYQYYGGGIPFIKIPDMHGKMFAIETMDSLTNEGADTQKKKLLPKGSVCVSCIATVGQVLITSEESFTNQQINSVVPFDLVHSPYLYFSMLDLYDHLHDLASGGSATLNLNTGNFSKIEILRPCDDVLHHFSEYVASIMTEILENYRQINTLSDLRDALLPKLLSGEIAI